MGLVLHQPGGSHLHSHGLADHGHSHGGDGQNINVRAAFVHVIGDLVQSVGVLIAAYIIYYHVSLSVVFAGKPIQQLGTLVCLVIVGLLSWFMAPIDVRDYMCYCLWWHLCWWSLADVQVH